MKKALIVVGLLSLTEISYAQVVTTSSSQLSTVAGSEISIQTTGNVTIAQDVSNAKVDLELNGATQTISENLTLRKLTVTGSGDKTINKNLTITESLNFISGILKPSLSAKILFTGSTGGITEGNDDSYVDGFFFNQNAGSQLYPVGTAVLRYAPATILKGDDQQQVGIRVVNQSPNFIIDTDSDVKKLDNTHYWEVSAPDLANINSRITLSLKGVDPTLAFDEGLSIAVVQADNIGSVVEGLSTSSYDNGSVTSQKVFTKAFLGVGASEEVIVSVIDMITPNKDELNDFLKVVNIEKFEIRRVRLLDRYGFTIKEWSSFTNYDDPDAANDGYDFNGLSSGNYICVVEYGNPDTGTKSIQQMVSVIKIKQ